MNWTESLIGNGADRLWPGFGYGWERGHGAGLPMRAMAYHSFPRMLTTTASCPELLGFAFLLLS